VKQSLFIVLAQPGAYAHMAHNGAGYAGRESLRGRVAARAVLLEDTLAFILWLNGLIVTSGFLCGRGLRL